MEGLGDGLEFGNEGLGSKAFVCRIGVVWKLFNGFYLVT